MLAVSLKATGLSGSIVDTFSAHLQSAGVAVITQDENTRAAAVIYVAQCAAECASRADFVYNPAPSLAVVIGHVGPQAGWDLLRAGFHDVVCDGDLARAAHAVKRRVTRLAEVEALLNLDDVRDTIVGRSPAWLRVLRDLVEIARYSSAGVLITGESGTGKEMAARLIHRLDGRANKGPLALVDCTTLSAELAASELFGHVRGAYTGAIAEREGAIAAAQGGTLFLDELGELPLPVQAQLLRAIEEGSYKPVGAIKWKRAQFRLVCATNRDLESEVEAGRFRLDLYHRVLAWHVRLPPLRERPEDIVPMARHFARTAAGTREAPSLSPAVERFLEARRYPGNIRDLRNLMIRTMARHAGPDPVTVGDIPPEDRPSAGDGAGWPDQGFVLAVRRGLVHGRGLKGVGRDAESVAMGLALRDADGNSRRAAELLGVTERAVQLRRAGAEPTGAAS